MTSQKELALRFRALHKPGDPIVLVNVWDAVSARLVESLGFPALATSSGAVAWTRGFPDGEAIARASMLAEVEFIVRAVSIPVSADLEAGYGASPADAAATAQGAIEAGAVGMNIEDWCGDELMEAQAQAERIAAIMDVAAREDIAFTVNARTDVYLQDVGENDSWRFAETVRRANLYLQAGAACAFVPGVTDSETIGKLVREIDGPLSVLAGASSPTVAELAKLGVARISVGTAGASLALAAFREFAEGVKDRGDFSPIARRMTHTETNALFASPTVVKDNA